MKKHKIMSITLLLALGIITIFGNCKKIHADETEGNMEEKCYLGTVVDAGDNDYSKSDKIDKDDIHSGWQLGQFYVSGFTQKSKDSDGNFVFLKNVGDKIKLYFNLEQNIDKLNGNSDLSISDDDNGSDSNLGVKKQNFKHGALIIRKTDYQNKTGKAQVYTDFLKAKAKKGANTEVELFEEGDYEVSLDYELYDNGFLFFNSYPNYKITFKFSVRNGNCMVYPFDCKTKAELQNNAITENGFYLDLAKSRYLDVMIKKEILAEGSNELKEDTKDTRFNAPAKDGDKYTDEGIYTITVKNKYTKVETTKVIYVGSNKLLKAYVTTGLSLSEIKERMDQGMDVDDSGEIVTTNVNASNDTKNNSDDSKTNIIVVLIIIVCVVVTVIVLKKKRKIPFGNPKYNNNVDMEEKANFSNIESDNKLTTDDTKGENQ